MATTLSSSLFSATFQGIQPSKPRPKLPEISTSKSTFTPLSNNSSFFRSRKFDHLQLRKDRCTVFANPAGSDSVEMKSEGSETSNAQGPPVLTILAGFVVFSLLVWTIGSIVMWLVGLIVNVPSSK